MKLKPCPFCGSKPELSTTIGYHAQLGQGARAWIWCPECKEVRFSVSLGRGEIIESLPHVKAPMEKPGEPFRMHPTVKAAIRPVVIAAVKQLWQRRWVPEATADAN